MGRNSQYVSLEFFLRLVNEGESKGRYHGHKLREGKITQMDVAL